MQQGPLLANCELNDAPSANHASDSWPTQPHFRSIARRSPALHNLQALKCRSKRGEEKGPTLLLVHPSRAQAYSGRMASVDFGELGPASARPRRHPRKLSLAVENDWPWSTHPDESAPTSPPRPRRRRRGDLIDHPTDDGLLRRRLTLEPPPTSLLDQDTHLSRSVSMRAPTLVVPVGPRAGEVHKTVSPDAFEHRRPVYIHEVEERSRSDSRRSGSRRDGSPRSGHPYRSTPESRLSPANSLSEEDDGTDTSVSSHEDRNERVHRSRGKDIPPIAPDPSRHEQERYHRPRLEQVVYEEDGYESRSSRYPPPVVPPVPVDRRSASRHSSDRDVPYRRPGDEPRESRHRSNADDSHRSPSRHTRKPRYQESEMVYASINPSGLRRSHTYNERGSHQTQSSSVSSSRRSSIIGHFLGYPFQAPPPERPAKLVQCIVCMDEEKQPHKTAKLKCGHRMCHSCLKRSFKLSLTDPQHMPPKCCTADPIPIKHVDRLFDTSFKKNWNKKFAEYSTRNRMYCPATQCGEWINPENISRDQDGRKYGRCGRCKIKVCGSCNGRWHRSPDCPRDEETCRILEQAKEEGWQRCHRCKAIVELKEGCNHMTCRCGAEFCMICGAKWKTCECPWFNYDAVESDRLEHMQVPLNMRSERDPFRGADSRFDHPSPPSPREFRNSSGPAPAAARPRPQNYDEEMLLRRLQEQRDEDLARRLESYGALDDTEEERGKHRLGDVVGLGNNASHHMNENYRRPKGYEIPPLSSRQSQPPPSSHPSHGPVSSHPSNLTYPPHAAHERGDSYVSGVNKARGVPRASSMERRLAERFNVETRQPVLNAMNTMNMMRPGHGVPHPMPLSPAGMQPMIPGAMYTGEPMPMAPAPPPAVPGQAPVHPVSRRHTEEEVYSSPRNAGERSHRRSRRERDRDRERDHDRDHEHSREYVEEPEVEMRMPSLRRRHTTQADQLPKDSVLAGLTGPGRGMDRVYEWRNYVTPGLPDGHLR